MLQQPSLWLVLLAFICAIGPLVFIHEFGHYLVAKLFGVGAEVFSIGFGPEIFGWTDRSGTRWKVGWLPLGGFVRFVGDMNPASTPVVADELPEELRSRSFHFKPVWQRFLIVLAGPMANFLLAILIFAVFFAVFGAPRTNIVGRIEPNSAAAAAGIRPGDRILSIGGRETPTFNDIRSFVILRPGEVVTVNVERGGSVRQTNVTLRADMISDGFGQHFRRGLLGVYPTIGVLQPIPIAETIPEGARYTYSLTRSVLDGLGQIISGRRSAKELGGPLKIAQIAGQQASLGAFAFIQLLALFSINLGFINLLPVPVLDGGHLFFYAVEAVRRRPVSLRVQDWAFRGGLALILALLLFTTINDLDSFGLWDRLGRLIG